MIQLLPLKRQALNKKIPFKSLLMILVISVALSPTSQAGAVKEPVEVPILGYHHLVVSGPLSTKSTMTTYKFERDMRDLKRNGYNAITFRDLYNFTTNAAPLPPKPIMITFDDGYSSNYELAYPILKKHKMKATIFVIGWCVGEEAKPVPYKPHISHFNWKQAKEMADSGLIEIESHTFDLHEIGGLSSGTNKPCGYGAGRLRFESDFSYIKRITADFSLSEELIRKKMNQTPMAIAYPFGKYDIMTELVSREFFKGTLTVKPGIRAYSTPKDLYAMPRILINEKVNVISAIDNWELQPWEPFLTDLEADMMSLPEFIASKMKDLKPDPPPKRSYFKKKSKLK